MSIHPQVVGVRYRRVRPAATCAFAMALSVLGCALAGDSVATRETAIIKWLQTAEQIDKQESKDPGVSPERQADFAAHAAKADLVIRKLQHGFAVPQSEIEEASEIPARTMRAREAAAEQLKQIRQDETRDERLNYTDDPVGLDRLRQEKAQTSAVIEKLEIDEFVPWTEIVQALQHQPPKGLPAASPR